MTHAVTEHESGLVYYMQSGAINESFSDIFGEIIQQTYQTVAPANRWLMGEDLSIGAIRSMKNPPSYSDPDKITSAYYYCGLNDNGGVHTNSGVGNKAAYLMVDGDIFNGKTVLGIGTIKTARVYYEAQTNLMPEGTDYPMLYNDLQMACNNLIGTSGISASDCQQVKNALDSVEMKQQPASCPSVQAPVCLSGVPHYIFNEDFTGNYFLRWEHAAGWTTMSGYNAIGGVSAYGQDLDSSSDSSIWMRSGITIPTNAWLHFNHAYAFDSEAYLGNNYYYDGGVVEYSINGGATWQDAGSLFDSRGYNGTIDTGYGNPLEGRTAFVGDSIGYGSSRLNLSNLAGQNVQFRFRIGSDDSFGSLGWIIDDVQIYTCASCGDQSVAIKDATYYYYPNIQSAYNAAAAGQTVMMQSSEYTENVSLAKNIYASLKGGYSCDFSSTPGWTTIHGSLTVSGGTVTVENLIVQ